MFRCAAISMVLAVMVGVLTMLLSDGKIRMYYPTPHWRIEDMPDLTGKTALVTGSNTGIGYATSLELLKKGCKVYVATRSPQKSKDTVKRMQSSLPEKFKKNAVALDVGLDLIDLDSVKKYADEVIKQGTPLNILINNAGIMDTPFALSKDGIESQMAVNHVGHYALTLRLMDLLEKGAPSRVVSVSSAGHNFARNGIEFDKLNNEKEYNGIKNYGYSKLANILFARSLARRVGDKKIFVNSLHPGAVEPDLGRHVVDFVAKYVGEEIPKLAQKALANSLMLKTREGATTQLYLATSPEVESKNISGEYYVPTARKANSNPFAFDLGMSAQAQDDDAAEELWRWTAKLTQLDL